MKNNNNIKLGKKIAKKFNKQNGIITYSGTLALEIALVNLNLEKNSYVLVSSLVCYSLINTIKKVGLKPIIVNPKNSITIEDEDIEKVLKKIDIKCILLVHQYGLINRIKKIKYKNLGIKIIEDVAQCFDINNKYYEVGTNSDYVITSFGKNKPLSYGIGGAILFDKEINNVDFYDNESRNKDFPLLSYSYPLCDEIDCKDLFNIGKENIKEQRKNAKEYYMFFKNKNFEIAYNKYDCYHRFIILTNDYNMYFHISSSFKKEKFAFQMSHEIELYELPLSRGSIYFDNSIEKKYMLLFRTRNINIKKQLEILKNIFNDVFY